MRPAFRVLHGGSAADGRAQNVQAHDQLPSRHAYASNNLCASNLCLSVTAALFRCLLAIHLSERDSSKAWEILSWRSACAALPVQVHQDLPEGPGRPENLPLLWDQPVVSVARLSPGSFLWFVVFENRFSFNSAIIGTPGSKRGTSTAATRSLPTA